MSALAAVLFALLVAAGAPTVAAVVPAAIAAWVAVELATRLRVVVRARVLRVIALALAAIVTGAHWRSIAASDQLAGLGGLLADRARLGGRPVIAPPVVSAAEPQSFFVLGEEGAPVRVRLGARWIDARPLGSGLFRADYDPRPDGVPAGDGPIDVSIEIAGHLHTRELIASTPLAHPRAFCASAELGVAAAPSEETDELFIVDRSGTVRTATTADGPTACVVLPAARAIAVVHRFSAEMLVLDVSTGAVRARVTAPARAIAIAAASGTVAVAVQSPPAVHLFDVDLTPREVIALESEPGPLAFGTGVLAVAGARSLELAFFAETEDGWRKRSPAIALGRPVVALAAAGERLFATVTDYRPEGDAGPNHHHEDQLLEIDPRAMRILARTPTALRDAEGVIGGASPMQIVPLAAGVVLACAGTDDLLVLEAGAPPRSIPALPAVRGVADLGEGRWAISSAAAGVIAVIEGDHVVRRVELAPANDAITLARRRGELAFWRATRSGASCQSCHLHADTDHALHDIGQPTPRPTLTVRGIARTAPYLRGASYAAIGELEHFASTILGGYRDGLDAEERSAALEAYLETLPPPPRPAMIAPERERTGLAAFVKARCDTCHALPAFTNLAQYPAPFLFPSRDDPLELLDVPSLHGAGARARFLHDGRARTLAAVLDEPDARDRHGATAKLDDAERRALLELLESL